MAASMDSADAQMARNLPAPATFAPSRNDVLSTLAFFFGDPAVPEKLKDYSEHHAMTFHFPDAYYGQNTKIRETLNNLILKSPQDWQTNVALPFVRIQGTTVEWDNLHKKCTTHETRSGAMAPGIKKVCSPEERVRLDRANELAKQNRRDNRVKVNEIQKRARQKFYKKNREKVLRWNAEQRATKHDAYLKRTRERRKKRRKEDKLYVIKDRLRARMRSALKRQKAVKCETTFSLCGCTPEKLHKHLDLGENEVIDHIFPFDMYDLRDEADVRRVMHYSNLQPLTERENRDKAVRLPTQSMVDQVEPFVWPKGIKFDDLPYKTEAGRQHFSDQLTSIRYCVQETCNFDAIFAYLTCGNYDFRYDLQKGLRPRRAVRQAMAHDIAMYAIAQKEGLGFDKAVEEAKSRMARYNVTPNMLIVPPQLLLYMALAPEEKIRYDVGGPAAVATFEQGVAGYESRAFRGMGVFTSTPYEVSDDQDSVQMLQRSTQVGEFYRMTAPPVWNTKEMLPPSYMDIVLYDEEKDQHVHIPFSDALYAAGVGDISLDTPAKGLFGCTSPDSIPTDVVNKFLNQAVPPDSVIERMPPNAPFKGPGDTDPGTEGESLVATLKAAKDVKASKAKEFLHNVMCRNLFVGGDRLQAAENLIKLVSFGVWLPLELVIARPFIEHMAMSAIMTVSGRETGATLFGPADMQISANTSVKTIEGCGLGGSNQFRITRTPHSMIRPLGLHPRVHNDMRYCTGNCIRKEIESPVLWCHTKSVITRPQNVLVMRDIMLSSYVAGGNTRWLGADHAGEKYGLTAPLLREHVTQGLTDRLSFVDDTAGEYESMLAFACPYGDGNKRDQVISLSQRLLPWEVTRPVDATKEYFPGDKNGFDVYSARYQLSQIHFGEDVRAAENMEFISQGSVNNALCFLGPHRKFSPFTANFYELVPGQGHFGPDAIPGDARWRRGESVSLNAARNSMVSLEVAAHSQLVMSKRTVTA